MAGPTFRHNSDGTLMTERLLSIARVRSSLRIPRVMLELDPYGTLADAVGTAVLTLEANVLREVLVDKERVVTHEFSFPSSPWQFFKRRHAGSWWLGWLVRWRPVRERTETRSTTVSFRQEATYPRSTISFDERLGVAVIREFIQERGNA